MSEDGPGPAIVRDPSPNELRDPFVRQELKRATVWLGSPAPSRWR